jgi:hypothetical protein
LKDYRDDKAMLAEVHISAFPSSRTVTLHDLIMTGMYSKL